ncbi:MyoD family inhibitor domain-containing protein [Bagarius yarrelli]|uniref:MyoD family inhibitor domain-containing protein n=1 Tax=Bagarius yarrelli TaxID=175774 RepID=A0A556V985_BAGYA|nr:MyoD family inhibitor domain-containing protein [Bagarius yarrelli]
MDVQQPGGKDQSHRNHLIQTDSRVEAQNITQQPDPYPAKVSCANRKAYSSSDDSLTDIVITNEDALLLPDHVPVIVHKLEKETPSPLSSPSSSDTVSNRSPPVCTPPSASKGQRAPEPAHVPKTNGHKPPHKKRSPSTSKSQQSLKTSASQVQEVADDDCCVQCVLACLFCELLPMCSALAQCLACGAECDALCCCGEACGGLVCCSGDPCSAVLDCAILEDCCQSSDCLEICLECCSICFPT